MRIPGSVVETPPVMGDHESTLSADLNVSGTISGHDLAVLGQFEGELHLAGQLRTGGNSRVKAVVKARAVKIEGEFEGEVRAESLRLTPTARARGTFVADRLIIEEGAMVHGAVNRDLPAHDPPHAESATELPAPADPETTPADAEEAPESAGAI